MKGRKNEKSKDEAPEHEIAKRFLRRWLYSATLGASGGVVEQSNVTASSPRAIYLIA